jgi:hypothetical protein
MKEIRYTMLYCVFENVGDSDTKTKRSTLKYLTFSEIPLNLCYIVRIRIRNNRITDPDLGGQLITDPSDPGPDQQYY